MDKMVYGQNGIGQNGMDKMARTKWYGSNITNKVINQSNSHLQYDFFINPSSTLTPSAFFYVLVIYLWLLVTRYILNSTELKGTQNIKLNHFVHTILSVPFCPIPFCPYAILSISFCPYHFVSTILSATILSSHRPTVFCTSFRWKYCF